mgnify:CR=1 FL=1
MVRFSASSMSNARSDFLKTYPGFQGAPEFSNINSNPNTPTIGENLTISVTAAGAQNVILAYRFGGNMLFQKAQMFDDGMHGDGTANETAEIKVLEVKLDAVQQVADDREKTIDPLRSEL